jgi:hypothetical protein
MRHSSKPRDIFQRNRKKSRNSKGRTKNLE